MSWEDFVSKDQIVGTLVVLALFASIPFGLIMAFVMDNPSWLWFCAPIFIFLS